MINIAAWRLPARAAAAGALAVGMLTVGVASAQAAEPLAGCQVQVGTEVPDLAPNLANPSAEDVRKAITAWLNEVCTVDSFLNNPRGIA